MTDFDVIVVGAGPAGSMAAQPLAQDGWHVALVEAATAPGAAAVCGGMLSRAMFDRFQLSADLIEKAMDESHYVGPWGTVVNDTSQVTVLRQDFDRYLAERAVGAGAELFTQSRAVKVHRGATGRIDVYMRKPRVGITAVFRARAVILADGYRTLARQCADIGFDPQPTRTAFALAYDLAWPNNPLHHFEVYFGLGGLTWGFGWIFPKKNVLNVGLGCTVAELRRGKKLDREMVRFINEHPVASEMLKGRSIVRRRGGFIPLQPARRIFGRGILTVGDAAGMVNPLFGSGLDNALEGGALAGHVMSRALAQDDLTPQSLSQYQVQWESMPQYQSIRCQERLSRWCAPLSRLDRYLLPRLIQAVLLGGRLSRRQRLALLLYPLLGNPLLDQHHPGVRLPT